MQVFDTTDVPVDPRSPECDSPDRLAAELAIHAAAAYLDARRRTREAYDRNEASMAGRDDDLATLREARLWESWESLLLDAEDNARATLIRAILGLCGRLSGDDNDWFKEPESLGHAWEPCAAWIDGRLFVVAPEENGTVGEFSPILVVLDADAVRGRGPREARP